jgi:hypothetical protein
MSEMQGEILHFDKREKTANGPVNTESAPGNFAKIDTEDLAILRKVSRILMDENNYGENQRELRQAEQIYKDTCLELFFRLHGAEYRNEYTKWLMIKKKKEQDWQKQMYDKYGPNWRERITESDREQLVYTSAEMEAYEKHKAIEEKAMKSEEKDGNKLQEKEESGKNNKGDYFKLVKIRASLQFPFLQEREVHSAVYSIDFLLFYMRLIARTAAKKRFNQMRGKEIPAYVEFERKINSSVHFVKEIAIFNRMKPRSTLFSLMQVA